jgi:hypothetical protein
MKNFYDFYEAANTHRGLYRIWVPLHDDGKAPLVCTWIDPSMTGFESEPCPGRLRRLHGGRQLRELARSAESIRSKLRRPSRSNPTKISGTLSI